MSGLRAAAGEGDRLAASSAHRAFHLALVALADSNQLLPRPAVRCGPTAAVTYPGSTA